MNAKNAGFVELVIKHMPNITPLITAMKENMNFEAMGSFRTLLEQALRKYEGKPGDTKGAMLGGILQMARNLPTSPGHIERYVESLFDWVILRISEAKKASQNYFWDPREGYSPLPTLDDLIGRRKENPVKKEYQQVDKGKRGRNETACRFCNNLHEGKCKIFNHPDAPKKGTFAESDKGKTYLKIRPDKCGPLRLGKNLSADMRSLVDYEPSDKERADHASGKKHFINKKQKFAKVATCIKTPTADGLTTMQILTHTSDNQGQTKSVPVDVLIDSGACDGSYISSELAIRLNELCVEIYPQREWIGVCEEDSTGVLSSGYVEVKMQFFDVLTQQISYFVDKLNIIDNPIFDVIIGKPTIDKHQLSMRLT